MSTNDANADAQVLTDPHLRLLAATSRATGQTSPSRCLSLIPHSALQIQRDGQAQGAEAQPGPLVNARTSLAIPAIQPTSVSLTSPQLPYLHSILTYSHFRHAAQAHPRRRRGGTVGRRVSAQQRRSGRRRAACAGGLLQDAHLETPEEREREET